jgi:DNA-binding protein YbaB
VSYVDDWNERQSQTAEEWRRRSKALRDSLAEIRARIATQGEELAVTTDAQGRVADVEIAPKALGLGAETLRRMLLQTIQQAQAEAARRAEDLVAEMSPEAAAALRASREFVSEDAAPQPQPEAEPVEEVDDEEWNDARSWLRNA